MPKSSTTKSAGRSPINSPQGQESANERREFFRIDDRIGLEVRPLAEPDQAVQDDFDLSPRETFTADYRRLDAEFRNLMASLAERDRLVTGLLKTLNSKLDLLARIIAFEQNPLQPEDWQQVTLSEGGLSFLHPQPGIKVGDILAIRMTLPPEMFQPEAVARVLELKPVSAGGCWVHTEFTELEDSDRQQIARHVMRWQIRQRQKA
ncbi:MAG TPA: PilZ domain-containing protein [Marinobacter sp.]|jgi:hypothetical protein|nr:PilZ domain-containing protein [Marinobacter sp.]